MGDDGDDKHPDPCGNHRLLGSADQGLRRSARHFEIDQVEAESAEQQAETDQPSGTPFAQANSLGSIKPGNDQGKRRCRQHHPGAETQQRIGQRYRHAADHQHRHCTQRGPQCTQGAPFERTHHAQLKVQPGQPLRYQQSAADQQQQGTQRQAKQTHAADGHHIRTHTGTTHTRAAT
ncbi:hypothetical protein D3C76_1027600 [compost metagenome]